MKNFLLVIASLLFALIAFEAGLQTYGYFLETQRVARLEKESDIRILAVGESTTDPLVAPEKKPWTYFLQQRIEKDFPGHKVSISNKGEAGMATTYIMRDLQTWINEYRPHLIISMMGINDRQGFSYLHDEDFFSQLRTVRLIRWWIKSASITALKSKIQEPGEKDIREVKDILANNFTLGSLAPEIKTWIEKHPGLKWYALKENALLQSNTMDGSEVLRKNFQLHNQTFEMFEQALELNPLDNEIVSGLVYHHGPDHKKRVVKALLNALDKNLHPDANLLTAIATHNFFDDPELEKIFRKVISLKGTRPIDQLRSNYLTLAETAMKNSIDLAIMAYPSTNAETYKLFYDRDYYFPKPTLIQNIYLPHPLAKMTGRYSGLIFIDNSSFPKHFDSAYYLDFFTDKTGVGFGHTTMKGHELIAENAYQALKKEWFPKMRAILTKKR